MKEGRKPEYPEKPPGNEFSSYVANIADCFQRTATDDTVYG